MNNTIRNRAAVIGAAFFIALAWRVVTSGQQKPASNQGQVTSADLPAQKQSPDRNAPIPGQGGGGHTPSTPVTTIDLPVGEHNLRVMAHATIPSSNGYVPIEHGPAITMDPVFAIKDITLVNNDRVLRIELEENSGRFTRLIEEKMKYERGEAVTVKPSHLMAMRIRVSDPLGTLLQTDWTDNPQTSFVHSEQIQPEEAERIREALKHDTLLIVADGKIDGRFIQSGVRVQKIMIDSVEKFSSTLQDANAAGLFTDKEAKDAVKKLKVVVEESFAGDPEVRHLIPNFSYNFDSLFKDIPKLKWGDMSDLQRKTLDKRLDKLHAARLTDEVVRENRLHQRIWLDSDTKHVVVLFPFFGGIGGGTDAENKVEQILHDTGIVMRKVEGTDFWFPWGFSGRGFETAAAELHLTNRAYAALNASPVQRYERGYGQIQSWRKSDDIKAAAAKAEAWQNLQTEFLGLQQRRQNCLSRLHLYCDHQLEKHMGVIAGKFEEVLSAEKDWKLKYDLFSYHNAVRGFIEHGQKVGWGGPAVSDNEYQYQLANMALKKTGVDNSQNLLDGKRTELKKLFSETNDAAMKSLLQELETLNQQIEEVQTRLFTTVSKPTN